MNKRAKFELKKPLVLWSLTLAVFSIFGAFRTGAYIVYTVMTRGLKHSVCDQGFYNRPASKFWAYAFLLSKAPQLEDPIFIILRKQKLIFLPCVLSVMYSYYALRAAGFRVSRKFAVFITLSQIIQRLIGCVTNYLVSQWMQREQCHSHFQNISWSSLMYLSYFVLFCLFFFEAYIRSKMREATKAD
ncbi:hypothetical protein JEQ12_011954 [Ovis aries]|uniref:Elongation of very long chain fatty acids protein n=1 Tax=Ovis aries TaxID=9940 RepID=A0A835ZND4_SHEEP|nr:hypothetical protein JEQ12_011954 [Ovis aries]